MLEKKLVQYSILFMMILKLNFGKYQLRLVFETLMRYNKNTGWITYFTNGTYMVVVYRICQVLMMKM